MRTISEELKWLEQADRARRLAANLPSADAKVLESFALECETAALRVAQPARPKLPRAA